MGAFYCNWALRGSCSVVLGSPAFDCELQQQLSAWCRVNEKQIRDGRALGSSFRKNLTMRKMLDGGAGLNSANNWVCALHTGPPRCDGTLAARSACSSRSLTVNPASSLPRAMATLQTTSQGAITAGHLAASTHLTCKPLSLTLMALSSFQRGDPHPS